MSAVPWHDAVTQCVALRFSFPIHRHEAQLHWFSIPVNKFLSCKAWHYSACVFAMCWRSTIWGKCRFTYVTSMKMCMSRLWALFENTTVLYRAFREAGKSVTFEYSLGTLNSKRAVGHKSNSRLYSQTIRNFKYSMLLFSVPLLQKDCVDNMWKLQLQFHSHWSFSIIFGAGTVQKSAKTPFCRSM